MISDSDMGIIAAAVFAGCVSGITGAMLWVQAQRKGIDQTQQAHRKAADDEFKKVWSDMRTLIFNQSQHSKDIAVLENEQRNHLVQLREIRDTSKDTNEKVDEMAKTLTNVLVELKSQGRH